MSDNNVRRPRVIAEAEVEALVIRRARGGSVRLPAASVRVEFDLHDHKGALALLDRLVEDVKRQISETENTT